MAGDVMDQGEGGPANRTMAGCVSGKCLPPASGRCFPELMWECLQWWNEARAGAVPGAHVGGLTTIAFEASFIPSRTAMAATGAARWPLWETVPSAVFDSPHHLLSRG
jgi:hypothetical protein